MSKKKFILVATIYLVIIATPFVLGVMVPVKEGVVFSGFLINVLDGNTYLAKMYQGWEGNWKFVLPYTSDPGEGAYLFLFYLTLGHISRLLRIPLLIMYHIVRVSSAILLLYAIKEFAQKIFGKENRISTIVVAVSAFGSGLGWLASMGNYFTSDYWVAEAYPFLSSYSNPHFTIGLALILFIFMRFDTSFNKIDLLIVSGLSLLLAIVLPFGSAIVVGVILLYEFVNWLIEKQILWKPIVAVIVPCCLILSYQYMAILYDPILSVWNSQNYTVAPKLLDFIISFSPLLFFSLWGIRLLIGNQNRLSRLLITWMIVGFIFTYLPFHLQRRFMVGYFIPVSFLGWYGLEGFLLKFQKHASVIRMIVITSALITNLIVFSGGIFAIINRNPTVFLESADVTAYKWIEKNTKLNAIILGSPETGLYIPAYSGRKVIYGHPYETVDARTNKYLVEKFYEGAMTEEEALQFITDNAIDYIYYGVREENLGVPVVLRDLPVVYDVSGVRILQVDK